MKSNTDLAELFKKYLEGKLSSSEEEELNDWIAESESNKLFFDSHIQEEEVFEDSLLFMEQKQRNDEAWLLELKSKTKEKIQSNQKNKIRKKNNLWYYAAAAVLVLFGFSFLLLKQNFVTKNNIEDNLSSILPGTNKAELILSNGKKVHLRTDQTGISLNDEITYSDGSEVLDLKPSELAELKATIQVPRGGKYQIALNDGTKVWLNSASKLTYPLSFEKGHREVTLEGEAYFEVSKLELNGKRVPFLINSKNQQIEVTGTQFNVSAYEDQEETLTTLVEGSVNIIANNQKIQLNPNQQSVLQNGSLSKKNVDINTFIAWKDNKFLFYETELKDVMRSLSRWYDISIEYNKKMDPTYFYGEISRSKNLSEVLNMLEKSGLKFKVEKTNQINKLIVSP